MNFEIRRAAPEDLDGVVAVAADAPDILDWSRAQFAEEIGSERAKFLVAEAGGGIVGFALVWIVSGDCQLLSMGVRSAAAGRGVGRALLAAAMVEAHRSGASVMTLEVAESNARARAVYERAGFRVVGRRMKYYNDGSDALLMDAPV